MSQGALISWKEECDAIHGEMDRLLTAGWPKTAEERQVRKVQFMALIERRNVHAHDLLKSAGGSAKFRLDRRRPPESPRPRVEPTPEVEIRNVRVSEVPPEAVQPKGRSVQPPPAEPPHAEPMLADEPLLEARKFLKLLGL